MHFYGVLFLTLFSLGLCKGGKGPSLSPEQSGKLLQHAMKCMGETGVNPEALVAIKNGKISDEESVQKFLHCIFKNIGIVKKDGHIHVGKAVEKYPAEANKDEIKKILEECNKESGNTPVETTFKVFKCFYAKNPNHLLF